MNWGTRRKTLRHHHPSLGGDHRRQHNVRIILCRRVGRPAQHLDGEQRRPRAVRQQHKPTPSPALMANRPWPTITATGKDDCRHRHAGQAASRGTASPLYLRPISVNDDEDCSQMFLPSLPSRDLMQDPVTINTFTAIRCGISGRDKPALLAGRPGSTTASSSAKSRRCRSSPAPVAAVSTLPCRHVAARRRWALHGRNE